MKNNWYGKMGAGLMAVCAMLATALMTGCSEKVSDSGVSEETGIALNGQVQVLGRVGNSSGNPTEIKGIIPGTYKPKEVKFCKMDETSLAVSEDCVILEDVKGTTYKMDLDTKGWRYGLLTVSGMMAYAGSADEVDYHAILESDNISASNVNILTEWKYAKTLQLVASGTSVASALERAEKEVLESIGIYGDYEEFGKMNLQGKSESDAVLVAASYLLDPPLNDLQDIRPIDLLSMVWHDYRDAYLFSDSFWESVGFVRPAAEMIRQAEKYVANALSVVFEMGWCDESQEGVSVAFGVNEMGVGIVQSGDYVTCTDGLWVWNFGKYPHTVGSMTDDRDGHVYKTTSIEVDGVIQTWMAEDLMYAKSDTSKTLYSWVEAMNADTTGFVKKDSMLLVELRYMYGTETLEEALAMCVEDGLGSGLDSASAYSMCNGSLFSVDEYLESVDVDDHQGICPDGWRIPSVNDWNKLYEFLGGSHNIKSTIHWLKRGYWPGEDDYENLDDIEIQRPMFDVIEFGAVPNVTSSRAMYVSIPKLTETSLEMNGEYVLLDEGSYKPYSGSGGESMHSNGAAVRCIKAE